MRVLGWTTYHHDWRGRSSAFCSPPRDGLVPLVSRQKIKKNNEQNKPAHILPGTSQPPPRILISPRIHVTSHRVLELEMRSENTVERKPSNILPVIHFPLLDHTLKAGHPSMKTPFYMGSTPRCQGQWAGFGSGVEGSLRIGQIHSEIQARIRL